MRVLFVCTSNVFRSVSAEYLLKDYAKKQGLSDVQVASAGTSAFPQPFLPVTMHSLAKYDVHPQGHRQTKLTEAHFKSFDVVVAMAKSHQDFIKEHFKKDVPLFNEIAYGEKSSIQDVDDAIPDFILHPLKCYEHVEKTVGYIHDAMPNFAKNVKKFMR